MVVVVKAKGSSWPASIVLRVTEVDYMPVGALPHVPSLRISPGSISLMYGYIRSIRITLTYESIIIATT